jgi:hypothetical protein
MDRSHVRSPPDLLTVELVSHLAATNRAQGVRELHDRGATREQIEQALRIMPFVCAFTPPSLLARAAS